MSEVWENYRGLSSLLIICLETSLKIDIYIYLRIYLGNGYYHIIKTPTFYTKKVLYPNLRQVKLGTVVEDDQKALFSIAITPGCRGGRYSFPYVVKEETTQKLPRWGQKVRKKKFKKINSQIKKPHLKMIPIKRQIYFNIS